MGQTAKNVTNFGFKLFVLPLKSPKYGCSHNLHMMSPHHYYQSTIIATAKCWLTIEITMDVLLSTQLIQRPYTIIPSPQLLPPQNVDLPLKITKYGCPHNSYMTSTHQYTQSTINATAKCWLTIEITKIRMSTQLIWCPHTIIPSPQLLCSKMLTFHWNHPNMDVHTSYIQCPHTIIPSPQLQKQQNVDFLYQNMDITYTMSPTHHHNQPTIIVTVAKSPKYGCPVIVHTTYIWCPHTIIPSPQLLLCSEMLTYHWNHQNMDVHTTYIMRMYPHHYTQPIIIATPKCWLTIKITKYGCPHNSHNDVHTSIHPVHN